MDLPSQALHNSIGAGAGLLFFQVVILIGASEPAGPVRWVSVVITLAGLVLFALPLVISLERIRKALERLELKEHPERDEEG